MFGFNHSKFKEAIKQVEEEKYSELTQDVNQVRAFIEKALSLSFECSAHSSRVNYPGIEL